MDPKILLISAPYKYLKALQTMPLGLINLGTILNNAGFQVKLIDINSEKPLNKECISDPLSPKEFLKKFRQYDPDIVAISSITENFPIAMHILQLCKKENEHIKTLYGGIHATYQAEPCLKTNNFLDVVAVGEVEHLVVDIVQGMMNERDLGTIQNIYYRENGYIKWNPHFTFPNLSEIPVPDFELIKDKHYPANMLLVEFSRGCPFRCAYCCLTPFFERRIDYFPIEHVIETIQIYENKFKHFSIFLTASNFLSNHDKVTNFLNLLKGTKITLNNWYFETRADSLNRPILQSLKDSGVNTLTLGIEDIHDTVLNAINKNMTFEQIDRGIKIIKELGLKVRSHFIIGLPTQTREDMLENINFSDKCDFYYFLCLVPYPGTPIFANPSRFGLQILPNDWEQYNEMELITDSVTFPLNEQKRIREFAWIRDAKLALEREMLSADQRRNYEELIELGFETWDKKWKLNHKTGWN
jgi:anaerobic magnesium-protoporphyrin IX monomethyl ester cyclase